jgi:spermidine/putrescine transport system substrate-binding protein
MNRLKFIDRMASGRVTRRDMMRSAAAFGVGLTLLPTQARAADPLTILEWSGYDAPDYYPAYIQKHGAPPAFSIFANEEEALQKVRAGFNADAIHPCTYSVGRFVDAGLVSPIDTAKLSNWKDIFPTLQTGQGVVADGKLIMAPADWGNSSIAYRPDLVEADYAANESWTIFTDDKYAGRVSMNDSEVAVEVAGLILGLGPKKIFEMTDDELAQVKPIVEKIVKNSRFLWKDPTEITQALASGEVVAAYAWNDAIKNLKGQGIPAAYARPKEGIFTWLCGMTLLNTGKGDVAAAHDFVDAWLSPETGKFLIEGSGYGHSNVKSFALADPEAVKNMGIVDPIKHLDNGILFQPLSSETTTKYLKMLEDTKALN